MPFFRDARCIQLITPSHACHALPRSQLGIGSTEHSPAVVVTGLPPISGVSGGERHR